MTRRCRECSTPVRGRRLCSDCAAERNARQPVRQAVETADGDRVGSWIRVSGIWHASIRFDGYQHGFACGLKFDDFPAEEAALDHYRVEPDAICPGCRETLEDVQILEEGFASAGELRADGGVEDRRETIVETDDGIAIGEDAIPMVVDEGGGSTSVLGPDPEGYKRERGER